MPELPEVETIRRDLADALLNQAVSRIDVLDRRLLSASQEKSWRSTVPGKRWHQIQRKGKYLSVQLDNAVQLIFHLRMTGQLVLGHHLGTGRCRLRLHFSNGEILSFYDQRRFGEVWLLPSGAPLPVAKPLGPDAIDELQPDAFVRLLKSKTTRIQALLMDQSCIAGVGNIYAQESLFRSGIRPTRSSRTLTKDQGRHLYQNLQDILNAAISARGTTSRNYRDARGHPGSAQTYHQVYQKGGNPCPRCTRPLRTTRVGGRGTVYCSTCQV